MAPDSSIPILDAPPINSEEGIAPTGIFNANGREGEAPAEPEPMKIAEFIDTSGSAGASPSQPVPTQNEKAEPERWKYRVRYRKAGDLRLVSHHDLMHVCERMFRRADLPIPVTQGFNPRPRMWFASAIALGIAGLNEVLEFEVSQLFPVEEIERRLTRQCPPGLEILGVRLIDLKASARVRRAWYRMPLAERIADLPSRCEAFFLQTESWAERMRPQPRRINIRPFVHEIHPHDDRIDMALWITPNGAARPEEVVAALGLTELLENGAVIERTDLEVYDELPPGTEGPPPIQSAIEEMNAIHTDLPQHRPTSIISNPMSFDS